MADMTYGDLQELTYAELMDLDYSFQSTDTGEDPESGTTGGNCVWTSDRITQIETQLSSIESKLDTLATTSSLNTVKSEILSACATATGFSTPANITSAQDAIISKCATATGFATPADVQLTTTTQEVKVVTQEVNVSNLATSIEIQNIQNLVEQVFALIARWAVTGNTLAVYNKDGSVMETFTLVRDGDGNITGCS